MLGLLIVAGIIGYLLGSANSSLIVGKFYGTDIRKHGSGNAGLTNTLRTLGKTAALFVLLGDVLKGILSYLIGLYITGDALGGMIGGTAAIIGHVWPVYFRFRGGKGVLTTVAVLFMMDWKIALILLGVFIVVVGLTRYVSLGSTLGAALFPVLAVLMHKRTVDLIFAVLIGLLLIVMHRANIGRLLKGTESKLGAKKVENSAEKSANPERKAASGEVPHE